MDKKKKQHRQKTAAPEEFDELLGAPPPPPHLTKHSAPDGASFSTEAGRAAQGMRTDLGGDPTARPANDPQDQIGDNDDPHLHDARAGGGAGAGNMRNLDTAGERSDVEQDRKVLFGDQPNPRAPESQPGA